jgi:hypothetical protein
MEQGIKVASFHFCPEVEIALNTGFLVENDELDAGQISDESGFKSADDPGDSDAGQLLLKAENNRNNMGYVTNGGEAENTDGIDVVGA